VSDTGAGMTPDVLARASEPFFTTKKSGQGTGLGLAMARGFAEQSDGGFHIESEPGRGTVVRLWFPVARAATRPSARLSASDAVAAASLAARRRLLMVDDDPIVLETLAQQMEMEGYTVLSAASGAEALERLDAGETVDLIVTDLSMPGTDGLACLREVRRRRPGLPAIVLTGFATSAAERALGDVKHERFTMLRKPIEGRALAKHVSVMLEGVAAGPERR
jgi:CheY-like chemotaxis protein